MVALINRLRDAGEELPGCAWLVCPASPGGPAGQSLPGLGKTLFNWPRTSSARRLPAAKDMSAGRRGTRRVDDRQSRTR